MVSFDKTKQFTRVTKDLIDSNWLLNQILGGGKSSFQITQISDDQFYAFTQVLTDSDLIMPDGRDSLVWLRDRLQKRYNESESKLGQNWSKVRDRYKFMVEHLDIILMSHPEKISIQTQPRVELKEQNLMPSFVPFDNTNQS